MGRSLFIFGLLFQTSAFSQQIVIEAYGDSLTAGLMASTNVTQQPELSYVSKALSAMTMFKVTGDHEYLKPYERRDLSWVFQLAKKLAGPTDDIEVRNYGVSGARVKGLAAEVLSAKAVPQGTKTIAFFFIGHNDLCHTDGTPEALSGVFAHDFSMAISEWEKRHTGGVAYFLPVSQVHKLYPLLDEVVWYNNGRGTYTCKDSWTRLFPYCAHFYVRHQMKGLEDYVVPRVNGVNASLRSLASKWAEHSRRNQYHFVEVTKSIQWEKHFFAVDCYHLSENGQSYVANVLYDEIKWQN